MTLTPEQRQELLRIADEHFPEDADERRQFDDFSQRLYGGCALLQISAGLGIQAKMAPQQGSHSKTLKIWSNECAKAARSILEPTPALTAATRIVDVFVDEMRSFFYAQCTTEIARKSPKVSSTSIRCQYEAHFRRWEKGFRERFPSLLGASVTNTESSESNSTRSP